MRRTLLLIVMAVVAIGAVAQKGGEGNKGPKSDAVKRALVKRDKAIEKADAAYRRAAADANKALLVELEKAKDAAFEAKDQHEVNAVAALIEQTERAVDVAGKGTAMAGTWIITWSTGESYRYEVNDDASVLTPEGGSTTVKSRRDGNMRTYWIQSPNGPLVQRLWLAGDYLIAETWQDPAAFERGERRKFAGLGRRPD